MDKGVSELSMNIYSYHDTIKESLCQQWQGGSFIFKEILEMEIKARSNEYRRKRRRFAEQGILVIGRSVEER